MITALVLVACCAMSGGLGWLTGRQRRRDLSKRVNFYEPFLLCHGDTAITRGVVTTITTSGRGVTFEGQDLGSAYLGRRLR